MAVERVPYAAVNATSLALSALRAGLTPDAAADAVPHLRYLLGTPALVLTGGAQPLAWDGSAGVRHLPSLPAHADDVMHLRAARVYPSACADRACPIRYAIVAPLIVEQAPVGVLCAYADDHPPELSAAVTETAGWIGGQVELSRHAGRLREAESRGQQPPISPHFIFNSLTAITSLMRTDPEQARELLQEFCDVTRYSFRRHDGCVPLGQELREIDHYLMLVRARFSDRLRVVVAADPEVLPVEVPFLSLQPMVESAIRHGIERKSGAGRITIGATIRAGDAVVTVADDGLGTDPAEIRRLTGTGYAGDGLADLHRRVRKAFGAGYGLEVESESGRGTTVRMRVPRDRPGAVPRAPEGS